MVLYSPRSEAMVLRQAAKVSLSHDKPPHKPLSLLLLRGLVAYLSGALQRDVAGV